LPDSTGASKSHAVPFDWMPLGEPETKMVPRLLAVELMTALADPATNVGGSAALRASFLPSLCLGLLDLRFRSLFSAKTNDSGLIRLLHGTLRMNSALRISSLAANRAKVSNRLWNDDEGLNAGHVAPNASGATRNRRECDAVHCIRWAVARAAKSSRFTSFSRNGCCKASF
jgi:hypothetical protein